MYLTLGVYIIIFCAIFLLLQLNCQQWTDFSFFFDPWLLRHLCPSPALSKEFSSHCLTVPPNIHPNLPCHSPHVPASLPLSLRAVFSISWPAWTVHHGISSPLGFRKTLHLRQEISATVIAMIPILDSSNMLCFLLVSPDYRLEFFHSFPSLTI